MRRLLFALLLAPMSAVAQDSLTISPNLHGRLPRCGPEMDGQAMCSSGVIYECVLISPNSLERRTGWRWQPDLLRGCDPEPPQYDPYRDGQTAGDPRGLPPGFTYAPQSGEYGTQSGQSGVPTTPYPGRPWRRY